MIHGQRECQAAALHAQIADASGLSCDRQGFSASLKAPRGRNFGCMSARAVRKRRPLQARAAGIAEAGHLLQVRNVSFRQVRPQDGGHAAQRDSQRR